MVQASKHKKNAVNSKSPTKLASPNRPRLVGHERRLSRFYEPLVLLYTLGTTRGEHTRTAPSSLSSTAYVSLKVLKRNFLVDLAYMCDYDKGGDTVTAVGLEQSPQGHVFWVASNTCPNTKIVPFLESLLSKMRQASYATTIPTPEETEYLATMCIDFATPRIKKYKSLLNPVLRRCLQDLAERDHEDVHGLAEWLRCWEDKKSPMDLCRFAYQERKSGFMQLLARLGTEPSYKSNRDAICYAFGLARHYIGRLGHHFRAANALLSCTPRLSNILHDFEVRGISIPSRAMMPPADEKTRLDSIIVRMLPAGSPNLDHHQQNLAEMDAKFHLSSRFSDNYRGPYLKPRVHAEIQVLEHFYIGNLRFADGDPFIACSHFVEPLSHQKIYLNWRPPDLNTQRETIGENHQRDILNLMTQDIRKEALQQIHEKAAPRAWHPDSLTGITVSTMRNTQEALEETTNDVGFDTECDWHEQLSRRSQSASDVFLDDSDEEGGVFL